MTFLRELVTRGNPLESISQALTGDSLHMLLSGGQITKSGRNVTPDSALRVGAALRGTQLIAGTVAGLPLKIYRRDDRSEVRRDFINGHNDYQTAFERWETVVAHMVLWGNAYLFKVRGRGHRIEHLVPVHPSRVVVSTENEQEIAGGIVRKYVVDGKSGWTSYDLMHIPCLSLDGVQGLGPISYAREMFGTALSAEEAAAKLFGQGLMLSGFLTTDASLDQGQARALKRKWNRTLQGAEHAGDVGILDNGARYESLAMPAKDAQFLESRKFQVTEIARLLGIPGWMMNDQEKSTSWGTGMEQQFSTWVITCLKQYMQRIEQRVQLELLSPTGNEYAEFKVEGLLRGDSKARAAFYNAGITGGWLVPNEPRKWENLDPVPWGDEPYLPHNQSADAQLDDDPPPDPDGDEDDEGDDS